MALSNYFIWNKWRIIWTLAKAQQSEIMCWWSIRATRGHLGGSEKRATSPSIIPEDVSYKLQAPEGRSEKCVWLYHGVCE